jgi:putative redox protein
MKATLKQRSAYCFDVEIRGHMLVLDTAPPFGTDQGPSPKELLCAAIGGCAAMDVHAYLNKHKISIRTLSARVEAETVQTHPKIFKEIRAVFSIDGDGLPPEKCAEAVRQSMTRYCGVSAMVFQTSPIRWVLELNGVEQASEMAAFTLPAKSS